jgi:hypothetical protein
MMTLGTIEEQINQVLDRKRELFAALITDGEQTAHLSMTQDEIFGLFNLQTPHRPHQSAA